MHIRMLTTTALFAALTAIFSQIAIPTPWLIPINLATCSVFLAGAILGARWGMASQFVYLALGMCGLPVFSGFRGGVQTLLGPTGGYIVGYVLAALVVGLFAERWHFHGSLILSMTCGLALCYALGTIWFMVVTRSTLSHALTLCVLPFLPGDALKIGIAAMLSKCLAPVFHFQQKT